MRMAIKRRGLVAATVLLLLFAAASAHADYGYTGWSDPSLQGKKYPQKLYCYVDESDTGSVNYTNIWSCLRGFNNPGTYQICRDHIDFDTVKLGSIPLKTEVLIRGDNQSSRRYFAFGPRLDDGADGQNTLTYQNYQQQAANFSVGNEFSFDNGFYKKIYDEEAPYTLDDKNIGSRGCGVRVKTYGTVLQNIRLTVNKQGIDGICVEANDVVLRNANVSNLTEGAGIVIGSGVNAFRFEGDYNNISNVKIGILQLGISTALRDKINLDNVKMDIATKYFIKTEAPVFIDADKLNVTVGDLGDGVREYTISTVAGAVTLCDTTVMDDGTKRDENCTPEKASGDVRVSSVVVYYIHKDVMGGGGRLYRVGNYEVAGGWHNTTAATVLTFTDHDLVNAVNKNRPNSEKITVDAIPGNPESADPSGRPIVFLMADTGSTIGSSSKVITLTGQSAKKNPNDPKGMVDVFFKTINECRSEIGLYSGASLFSEGISTDTDGDGIFDVIEMAVKRDGTLKKQEELSCECDENLLTCWQNPDTDTDGIVDGVEAVCDNGMTLLSLQSKLGKEVGQWGKTDYKACSFRDWARNPDSDGDGLLDGEEDRSRLYNPNRRAFFYHIEQGTVLRAFSLIDRGIRQPRKVACYEPQGGSSNGDYLTEFSDFLGYKPSIGIVYGIYYVSADGTEMELITESNRRYLRDKFAEAGGSVVTLACRNAMLSNTKNFNGGLDDIDRSDPRKADTDDDGICDGVETVAGICDKSGDKCPRQTDVNNNCKEPLRCIPGEMIDIIGDAKYMNDNYTALKLDADGIPLLFSSIGFGEGKIRPDDVKQICGDFDDDGIPNCVEAYVMNDGQYTQIGQCPLTTDGRLSPFLADSDNDGKNDNIDKCPTEEGESCNPYEIYQKYPVLAWFLDRDGDGMRDAEELCYNLKPGESCLDAIQDVGYFGRYNSGIGQTSPFKSDTDEDGLDDNIERQFAADPNNADTDGDFLTDYEEANGDGDPRTLKVLVSHAYTCTSSKADTDLLKADTDGDGVMDGIEVKVLGTSPNNPDSDGDSLCDGDKAVGKCIGFELVYVPNQVGDYEIRHFETNPCNPNTDGDGKTDAEEFYKFGCGNSKEQDCDGPDPREMDLETYFGGSGSLADADKDGLPDWAEDKAGTFKDEKDTDGDGLYDGCVNGRGELCNWARSDFTSSSSTYFRKCSVDFLDCDTDPLLADSDGDGLNDKIERDYQTNPWKYDTDGDCIPDGPMVLPVGHMFAGAWSEGEDRNANGVCDSDETCAASAWTTRVVNGKEVLDMWEAIDTDGDGIPDGRHTKYSNFGYEDANCNGVWDVGDELNPLSWDSDGDGIDDWSEMSAGGWWNIANLGQAIHGRRTGCSMTADAPVDMSVVAIFAGLLIVVTSVRSKIRRRELETIH